MKLIKIGFVLIVIGLVIAAWGTTSDTSNLTVEEQIKAELEKNKSIKEVQINEGENGWIVLVVDDYPHNVLSARIEVLKITKDVFQFDAVDVLNVKIMKNSINSKGHEGLVKAYTSEKKKKKINELNIENMEREMLVPFLDNEVIHPSWQ